MPSSRDLIWSRRASSGPLWFLEEQPHPHLELSDLQVLLDQQLLQAAMLSPRCPSTALSCHKTSFSPLQHPDLLHSRGRTSHIRAS